MDSAMYFRRTEMSAMFKQQKKRLNNWQYVVPGERKLYTADTGKIKVAVSTSEINY